MQGHIHDRGHRTQYARLFLAIAFVLQRIGDVAVLWFTYRPGEQASLLRGITVGSILCTSALLIGVWRRLRWARYVLTGLNWAYIALLSFSVLQSWDELEASVSNPYGALILGAVLYTCANVILVRSRRVRHFASK
jgi:Ca2+/H+ antiporter